MLDEATQECEADSIERLLTTWFLQNKQDIGKVGSKVTELTALYRRNVVRYRYSKKVAGVLSAKLQKALKNNTPVVAATESVRSEDRRVGKEFVSPFRYRGSPFN